MKENKIQAANELILSLLKMSFLNQDIFRATVDNLKYEHIPHDEGKEMLEYLFSKKVTKKTPSFEEFSQILENKGATKSIVFLGKVKNHKEGEKEGILEGLNKLILRIDQFKATTKLVELYNKGEIEKSNDMLIAFAETFKKNQIGKEAYQLTPMFKGMGERFQQRIDCPLDDKAFIRVPSCIPQLNHLTGGGFEEGSLVIGLALRGIGKSTWLRSEALNITDHFIGDVLFFQAEGTKREIFNALDSSYTGISKRRLKSANFSDSDIKRIELNVKNHYFGGGGEIYVYVFDEYSKPSMDTVNEVVKEYIAENGKYPAAVILDYIALFSPPSGRYDDARQETLETIQSARRIATCYRTVVYTAWQARIISDEKAQSPTYTLSVEDVSEMKQIFAPATTAFSMNRTDDEKKRGVVRIKILKHREDEENGEVYVIKDDYNNGRFCDKHGTLDEYFDVATGTNKIEIETDAKQSSSIEKPIRISKGGKPK